MQKKVSGEQLKKCCKGYEIIISKKFSEKPAAIMQPVSQFRYIQSAEKAV